MNNTMTSEGLGKGDPVDTLRFDEADTSTIDMTEIIDYDKQLKVHRVISGVEQYVRNGTLSPLAAQFLGVKTQSTSMDPLGSVYNDRFGGEGFFETTMKALETGVLTVIRFIKKIVLWCVDKIKILFGLKPSDRQAAIVKEKMPELKQQLGSYLTAMGFPAHLIDLDKFLADVPEGRIGGAIKFMSTKLISQEEYLSKFTQIPGMIQNICRVIARGAKSASAAKGRFTRQLDFIVQKGKTPGFDFEREGGKLRESMLEVVQSLNYKEITPELSKLLNEVMGQTLTGDDFALRSTEIAQKITASITTAQEASSREFVAKIEQILAKTTVENFEKLDLQKRDMTGAMEILYKLSDASELQKIAALGQMTGTGLYMTFYKEMVGAVNVYTNYTKVTMEILRLANSTFSDLGGWYSKATAFMLATVNNDVQTVSKLMLDAQQKALREGREFSVDMTVNGIPKLVTMHEADAQTFMEKAADISDVVITSNMLNIKTAINNFGKDAGLGKLV